MGSRGLNTWYEKGYYRDCHPGKKHKIPKSIYLLFRKDEIKNDIWNLSNATAQRQQELT